MNELETAGREIYWNVSHPFNQIVMYGLFAASAVVFCWGVWRRVKLWSSGKEDTSRFNSYPERFLSLIKYVVLQSKTNEETEPKIFHTLIFWGFMALTFATTMVLIHQDLGIEIYKGTYYLAVSVIADVFGLALIVGILIAFHRRFIKTPDRLHNSKADSVMLGCLLLLAVQGFAIEGMRIYATNDPWVAYQPVGWVVSLMFAGLPVWLVKNLHWLMWWFHAVTVFVFFATLPYTKFFHILASSANLFFKQRARPKGALKNPGDLEAMMEAALSDEGDGEFSVGTASIKDYSWKQLLDLDACTSCGRCQSVCPAYNSGKMLSPKWLMLDSRNHMLTLQAKGEFLEANNGPLSSLDKLDSHLLNGVLVDNAIDDSASRKRANNDLVENEAALSIGEDIDATIAGGVISEEVFWSCTTCRACEEVCPVGIEHVDHIVENRRHMALMEGNIPSEAQPALRAIETRGNPFGPAEERSDWADGLDVNFLSEGDEVDVLYWVGCISAYDKRKQSIARSMVKILNASGLSWGLLGNKESCTGDPARRLGEENLFQSQAKCNIEVLKGVSFKRIVANCPHCFNTLKNEYPDFGFAENNDVIHHTHFIKSLVSDGALSLKADFDQEVTFHDPCYLGRYNDTFDEPRDVLVQIGATKLKEMSQSRERGLCCGAGGGHFWFDMKVGERVNVQRVEQAAETGASLVATGCPFCMQMMEDGTKLTNREESLAVKDIAELVADSII